MFPKRRGSVDDIAPAVWLRAVGLLWLVSGLLLWWSESASATWSAVATVGFILLIVLIAASLPAFFVFYALMYCLVDGFSSKRQAMMRTAWAALAGCVMSALIVLVVFDRGMQELGTLLLFTGCSFIACLVAIFTVHRRFIFAARVDASVTGVSFNNQTTTDESG